MLDFALHGWDVVEALGLKNPILVGHSMGGMIAAEMAALAPNDVSRLALICPAGLWLDEHPIVDIFTLLPFEMPGYLFHDPEKGAAMMTAGLDLSDPKFLQDYLVRNARQMGMAGKLLFPVPERGPGRAALPGEGQDGDRLGRKRQADPADLRPRLRREASPAPSWSTSPKPATWSSPRSPATW